MANENDDLRDMIRKALEKKASAPAARPAKAPAQNQPSVQPTSPRSNAPTSASARAQPTARQQTSTGEQSYRFLNPYNFVRWMDAPRTFADDPDTRLLARCEPPPHDRYVGMTGKIACQLENVTPLFISDSEGIEPTKSEPEHKVYRFFRFDFGNGEEPALPATSLRGMLRSTFEAVTNSCFAHFDYDARLSYHLPATESLKLIPGRVEQAADGSWRLRLLPGSARMAIGERPRDKLYAARVEQYEALAPGRRPKRDQFSKPIKPVLRKVDLQGLKHGDRCFALASDLKFPPVWDIEQLASKENRTKLRQTAPNHQILEGYLCITNQNIEAKRFERFFFRDPANRFGAEFASLTDEVHKHYNELIADYQQRHKDDIAKARKKRDPKLPDVHSMPKKAGYSRFMFEGEYKSLSNGDLVYAMLSGPVQAPKVEFIVPVAIPRLGYERKVFQLLPQHLHKCEEYNNLCPACRTFGWVYGKTEGAQDNVKDLSKNVAYAGRVRIEHGKLLDPQPATLGQTTLAILSTPKPTTTRFYLKPSDDKPRNGTDDFQAGYDNRNNVLRGRKIYRHHGHDGDVEYWQNQASEHKRPTVKSQPIIDDQNRTLLDPLAPGAKFEFTIHFENLAEVELGALLWSLQLEAGMVHRLGLAKPLGFGSVKVMIQQVLVMNPTQRYSTLQSNQSNTAVDWGTYIQRFQEAMRRSYGQEFVNSPHIRDLRALLSNPDSNLPIHYPRPEQKANPEGKNFEWFMGNNRNRDARLVLEMPAAEQGLPLIDKTGYINV